jgi:protein TonB
MNRKSNPGKNRNFKAALAILFLVVGGLLFTQCKSKESKEETTSTTEVTETKTPPAATTSKPAPTRTVTVVKERPKLVQKHRAKAAVVEQEPEQYAEIKHEDIVVAPTREKKKHIVFVPHRTTYTPAPVIEEKEVREIEPVEAHRLLTEFDTPPMYAFDECQDKKHAEHCMHVRLQRYFSSNISRSVFPDDGEDHVEYATFIIKADGTVDPMSIEVVDQAPHCEPCAEEAKRLVKGLNDWKPGTWNGKDVPVRVTLPIRFHEYTM